MTSLQDGTQVPATHIRRSHLVKTFDGSCPLKYFRRTANPKRMKNFRIQETLPDIWKVVPETWYTALMYDIHQYSSQIPESALNTPPE